MPSAACSTCARKWLIMACCAAGSLASACVCPGVGGQEGRRGEAMGVRWRAGGQMAKERVARCEAASAGCFTSCPLCVKPGACLRAPAPSPHLLPAEPVVLHDLEDDERVCRSVWVCMCMGGSSSMC